MLRKNTAFAGLALCVASNALASEQTDLRDQIASTMPVMKAAPDPVNPQMATVEAEGQAVYSYPIDIPPAILAPKLALVYSSATTVSREVGFGWTLSGILQIERPTQSAFDIGVREIFDDGEYLLSGEAFSGLLEQSGSPGHVALYSSIPNLNVTADASPFDDAWTVESSTGDKWVLSAVGTVSGSSTVEPNLWRATQKIDRYGNEISYEYDTYGRIAKIYYGQSPGLAEPSTVLLEFVYPQVPIVTRYDGRSGALDVLHPELLEIVVNIQNAAGTWVPEAGYLLDSDSDPTFGVTRVAGIDHYGFDTIPGPATHAPGVRFEYTDATPDDAGVDVETSWEHTWGLTGLTDSVPGYATNNHVNKNESCEMGALYDLNGDGLKDFVVHDGGVWTVRDQTIDEDGESVWSDERVLQVDHVEHIEGGSQDCIAVEKSWGFPGRTGLTEDLDLLFGGITPWDDSYIMAASAQLNGLYDVDGDGYLDLVESTGKDDPNAHDLDTDGDPGSFLISFGYADGFEPEIVVDTPDEWTKTLTVTDIGNQIPLDPPATDPVLSDTYTYQLFADVDGDGWIDIVRDTRLRYATTPNEIEVAFHSGDREKGWDPFVNLGAPPGTIMPLGFAQTFDSSDYNLTKVYNRVVDMNGDGILDIIQFNYECDDEDAWIENCDWLVYFGRGREGWPGAVHWRAPAKYIEQVWYGDEGDSVVDSTLLDVNGDGLVDMVNFDTGEWWPSNGTEFADVDHPLALPTYLQDMAGGHPETGGAFHNKPTRLVFGRDWTEVFTHVIFDDINGDGLADAVGLDAAGDLALTLGVYREPNVLDYLETDTGRDMTLEYMSSNHTVPLEPVGEYARAQYVGMSFPIPTSIQTTDEVTGMTALSTYYFEHGVTERQAFLGFENLSIDIDADYDQQLGYDETYSLRRGRTPLLLTRDTWTDWCRPFAPSLDEGCTGTWGIRQQVTNTYTPGDNPLIESVTFAVRGDTGSPVGPSALDFSWREIEFTYANGFVDTALTTGPDAVDTIEEFYHYEPVDPDYTVMRLTDYSLWGTDPANPAYPASVFEQAHTTFDWNEQGFLESISRDGSSITGGASSLTTTFEPDDRGQVKHAENAQTKAWQDYEYGFGDAVLSFIDYSGYNSFTYEIDRRGRALNKTDVENGLEYRYTYDGLDRLILTELSYDAAWHPLEYTAYHTDSVPNWKVTGRCPMAKSATECSDWLEQYTSFDGGGNRSQVAVESPTGTGFAYSEYTSDLLGREVSAYDGLQVPDTSALESGARVGDVTAEWYYDPLGDLREVDRDTGRPGTRVTERRNGLDSTETDEEGRIRRVVFNSRGLPTEVYVGDATHTPQLKGTYTYDAFGHVTSAVDGGGTTTTWLYDRAGRLRSTSSLDSGETDFTYKGELLETQTNAAGGTATWEYDDLERPIHLAVSDPILTTADYWWQYDLDWAGAVSQADDTYGITKYGYGSRGELTSLAYESGGVAETEFQYTRDQLDRVVERDNTTTGRAISTFWNDGGVPSALKMKAVAGVGAGSADVTYDVRGRLTQWTGGADRKYQATFSNANPLPDQIMLIGAAGATLRQRAYDWASNDLLMSVTDGTGAAAVTTTFTYDEYAQLASATGGWDESYTWDAAGNPKTVIRWDGTNWHYAAASPTTTGNRVASRNDGAGVVEKMTYDAAGRLATLGNAGSKAHYEYDGLGRLRRVWGQGTGYAAGCAGRALPKCVALVLDWDADNTVVRRADGDPSLSKTAQTIIVGDWSRDEAGVETEEFGVPGKALGKYIGATRSWNFQEADGQVSATLSDAGTITSTRDLSAYGAVRASTGSATEASRRFGEHRLWFDLGGKLVAAGPRHFAPLDGQFLQPDPGMLHGISTTQVLNPLSLNTYRYASNAPTSRMDRDGDCPFLVAAYAVYEVGATISDIYSSYQSIKTAIANPTPTNVGTAVLQTGMTLATLGPLPSGEATGVRLTAKAMNAADDVGDTVRAGEAAYKTGSKATTIAERAVKGKAWEAEVAAGLEAEGYDVGREVTLETATGTRTRMDIVATRGDEIRCIECKSSATAPLTPGQAAAHPDIATVGATVKGAGKPNVPGGTTIAPTTVEVVRPP